MSRSDIKRAAVINLAGLARSHTDKALAVLVKALDSPDEKTAIDAASRILDRGYGKPAQAVEMSGDPDAPLNIINRIELVAAGKRDHNPG